jgi:hypothetical protein
MQQVHGIDLNPLAVLTARINYFIRISHLIPNNLQYLQIPIYLGDACYVPEKIEIDGVECLQYAIKTVEKQIEITMPTSLVKRTQKFSEIMNEYEKSIKKQDFDDSLKLLTTDLPQNDQKPLVIKELKN